MPTVIKRSLKSWMLVYVGFALALTAADIGSQSTPTPALVSPGTLPAELSIERSFFQPTVAQRRRNDI
jgi:hypothetical protein